MDESLKKALTGHLEEVALALKTPAQLDTDELPAAMMGLELFKTLGMKFWRQELAKLNSL